MNATDVYVEQLIIGGLVVVIAVVLWTGALPAVSNDWEEIAIYLGAAYLAGLMYDRIGDSLLERIEQRQRLRFATRQAKKKEVKDDPYPEDRYRAVILSHGEEELARQYNYLRTRLRLTRAVASLLPAATVAWLVHRSGMAGWLVTFDVAAAYALVATVNVISDRLPRTEAFAEYGQNRHRWRTAYGSSIAGLLALLALMFVLARDAASYAVIAAGLAATILAGWVWIRITGTFMAFLRDANELSPTAPAPRECSDTSPRSPDHNR